MMRKLAITCKLVFILSFTVFLVSCVEFQYVGDYPELYSVAIHSILGARGYGDNKTQPIITTLEKDRYGRILFYYNEGVGGEERHHLNEFAFLIIQKVEGDYAYFYPHYNFILNRWIDNRWIDFKDEEIETLQEVNSWNKPLSDSSEFERVRIVRQKEEGPLSNGNLIDAYRDIFPNLDLSRTQMIFRMNFLRADNYGRAVYHATGDGTRFAVLFQPDHSFDLETGTLLIEDHNNYQTELRLWMEANGWNTPWEE